MPIITILIVLVVIGFLLWLVNSFVPMPELYKRVLTVLIICLVVLWLLSLVLGDTQLGNVRVG